MKTGEIQVIETSDAPNGFKLAGVPLSQGVRAGNFIFISGQVSSKLEALEPVSQDIKEQTELCLNYVRAVLEAGGASMRDVVKVQIFLTDLTDFAKVNGVYKNFFPPTHQLPARSAFGVKQLASGFKVEIEAIAFLR